MTFENQFLLDRAVAVYKDAPSAENLLGLNQVAVLLMPPSPVPTRDWLCVEAPDAFAGDFGEIRVVADCPLNDAEVSRLSGALGYALRQALAGEDLSAPTVGYWRDASDITRATVLEYGYDSTKSRRDDPDFEEAFALARVYSAQGSPVRTTNRAGHGTRGTRLVEAVGPSPMTLTFYVR